MALSTLINCHKAIAEVLVVIGLRVVMSSGTLSLAVTVNYLTVFTLGESRSRSQSFTPPAIRAPGLSPSNFMLTFVPSAGTVSFTRLKPVVPGQFS